MEFSTPSPSRRATVRREVFLLDDLLRLRDVLDASFNAGAGAQVDPENRGEADGSSALGVGFFSTEPLEGGHGVGLTVAPPFLESALRSRMAAGHAAPYTREVLLFGDDATFHHEQSAFLSRLVERSVGSAPQSKSRTLAPIGISRWIVAGVHPGVFRNASAAARVDELWPAEVAEASSPIEALHALLGGIHQKVLGLRPVSLVFLLESGLLGRYFRALSAWKKAAGDGKSWDEFLGLDPVRQEESIGRNVLSWLAEEGLHPRVALVCRTPREHETLLLLLHRNLVKSPSCANVLFRL
jgi:hypothetical protein